MKRLWMSAGAALLLTQSPVHALNPPSAADGPLRLLSCVVDSRGILEAVVDNTSDDELFCDIRCDYEVSGRTFTHVFSDTIPKRFQGRVGRFETPGGRPGNFRGEVGRCSKV